MASVSLAEHIHREQEARDAAYEPYTAADAPGLKHFSWEDVTFATGRRVLALLTDEQARLVERRKDAERAGDPHRANRLFDQSRIYELIAIHLEEQMDHAAANLDREDDA